MNRLMLEWVEASQVRNQTLTDPQSTKNPGTFRIGRDPAQCDLVIQHPTVSKLHIEIFFVSQLPGFYLRNLRETNPPLVDQQRVTQSPVELHSGATIRLGEVDLIVRDVQLVAGLASTVVAVPAAIPSPAQVIQPFAQPIVELSYGLQCPKCNRVSPYEHLEVGCAWCGTSLASAHSALILPGHS